MASFFISFNKDGSSQTSFDKEIPEKHIVLEFWDKQIDQNGVKKRNNEGVTRIGSREYDTLIYKEGTINKQNQIFNIYSLNYFIVAGNKEEHILRYNAVDVADEEIIFVEENGNVLNIRYIEEDDRNILGSGVLEIGGNSFRVVIKDDVLYPIAIDLNGDGVINGAIVGGVVSTY